MAPSNCVGPPGFKRPPKKKQGDMISDICKCFSTVKLNQEQALNEQLGNIQVRLFVNHFQAEFEEILLQSFRDSALSLVFKT